MYKYGHLGWSAVLQEYDKIEAKMFAVFNKH